MATNKQMEIVARFILLFLLALVSIHCAGSDFSSENIANLNFAHYEQTASTIYYKEAITLTSVYVRPWTRVLKGEPLARALYSRRGFIITAPFDGLVGNVFVKYGEEVQSIQPNEILCEIFRRLEPFGGPEITDHDKLIVLGKHAPSGFPNGQPGNELETVPPNLSLETAGEYQSEKDEPLFFTSRLSCDAYIMRVLIKRGQMVTANQPLMLGVRNTDGFMLAVFAPHDGEILAVSVQDGGNYKAGHALYVMRVELPDPLLPSIQTSQGSLDNVEKVLQQ